jgi:imidazolonepropionase-like amidohydrolase
VAETTFVVRGARVFDGERIVDAETVVVRNGVIADIGHDLPAASGIAAIDGSGQTLLPGLIDAHVHTPGGAVWWGLTHVRQALACGVTTVLCMGTDPATVAPIKDLAAQRTDLADLRSAGWCATAPGGHPTQWSDGNYPTISTPRDAAEFVAARAAEGMDHIKIVIEDDVGHPCPILSPELTDTLVREAHAHDLIAVAHVSKLRHAEQALDSGVDGLAHLYWVDPLTDDFVERMVAAGTFVVVTFAVGRPIESATLAADPHIAPYIAPVVRERLAAGGIEHRGTTTGAVEPDDGLDKVQILRAAGVPILAGTDSPGIGAIGPSLHLELDLLVRGGLTPTEALTAATVATAKQFRISDRGRIAPGCRADLILVKGDPTRDIRASREITRIWRGGAEFDRIGYQESQRSTLTEVRDWYVAEMPGVFAPGVPDIIPQED